MMDRIKIIELNKIKNIWLALTEPAELIEKHERYIARLLASILLCLIPLAFAITAVPPLLDPQQALFQNGSFLVVVGGAFTWIYAYRLSRTIHYRVAGVITLGSGVLSVFATAIYEHDINKLAYLLIIVLIGSTIFSPRTTALLTVICLLGILFITPFVFDQTFQEIIAGPVTFFLIGSVLIFVTIRFRDLLEHERQAVIENSEARYRQLFEASHRQAQQLEVLRQVTQDIVALQDLDTLLYQIISRALELIKGEAGGLYLYRPEKDALEWVVAIGTGVVPLGTLVKQGEGLCGEVWATGETTEARANAPETSTLGVPIRWGDDFLGVLKIRAKMGPEDAFSEDVRLLASQFADQAAIAIHNIHLYDQAKQEIAERKQVEAALRESEAEIREQARQMEQIMDTVPEGMLLLDNDRQVLMANPLGSEALGVLAQTKVGDVLTSLGRRSIAELLTSPPFGLWHELEVDGRIFELIGRPLELESLPKGWVLVVRDVTKEREVLWRQQQQERLAAVGQLAAGIAHDFNNIMAAIMLYAEISLLTPDLPPKLKERLETIAVQSQRATDLIQQILDFSRRSVFERQTLDLLPMFKEEVKLLKRTLPENIKINLTYADVSYLVKADPTRMQQVFMNLAVNARDAMQDGGELMIVLEQIEVQNSKHAPLPDMDAGEWVQITVKDTGMGIAEDKIPYIYEPFFTTKAPGKGSGLGLAQVYGIVRQHEGHIVARSHPGEGATFIIYLPASPLQRTQLSADSASTLVKGHGETILVVEDNEATRKALINGLEMLGYRVLEASDGRVGLAVYDRFGSEIDLVLTDLVMPEMGGKALVYALKMRNPKVKTLILTGHPLGEYDERLNEIGSTGWISKPVSLERLAEFTNRALQDQIPV